MNYEEFMVFCKKDTIGILGKVVGDRVGWGRPAVVEMTAVIH